jgi:dephospho-CoA kinase
MKILGLTGGIGSGKSVVAELLRMMGIPVYDSDTRSKVLCDTDEYLKKEMIGLFGPELYTNGLMNRELLAKRIFGDEAALKAVNALIHPAVERDFKDWVKAHSEYSVVVQESAILFEAGFEHLFDQIICVTAPEDIRIERVCKRSGVKPEIVRERMKNQIEEAERISKSDIILVNDGVQALLPQVKKMIQELS